MSLHLASGEGFVTLVVTLSVWCMCWAAYITYWLHATLVLAAKVMRCTQCSTVIVFATSSSNLCIVSACLTTPPFVCAMSTSESCGVNGHIAQYTSPISMVSQCKLVSGWGLRKWRSAPPHMPSGSGRTLLFCTYWLSTSSSTVVTFSSVNLLGLLQLCFQSVQFLWTAIIFCC